MTNDTNDPRNDPRADELRHLMRVNGWRIEDICNMLPVNGRPRKRLTVQAWLQSSQKARPSDDCLEVLRLRAKLARLEKKLKDTATATATATNKPKPATATVAATNNPQPPTASRGRRRR